MVMKFFTEDIKPYVPSIKGAKVSISMRRGQVSFSDEASKLMGLETGKTFLAIGYDEDTKILGFKVSSAKGQGMAEVEDLMVYATKTRVHVIYAGSTLEKISAIPTDGSHKFQITKREEGLFCVDLTKGKKNPKAKSKAKGKKQE
jgi:hypothetical protein